MLEHMRGNLDRLMKEKVWWVLDAELRMEAGRNPEFRARYPARDAIVAGHIRHMLSRLCDAAGCGEKADIDYIAFVVQSFTQGLHLDAGSAPLASTGTLLVRLLLDLMGRPPRLAATAQ